MKKTHCTAIVLAAGRGKRMGVSKSKMYLEIQGRPVIYYSLKVFEESALIDDVILVTGKGQIPYCRQEIVENYGFQKIKAVVEGGAERYHSVWEGLRVLKQEQQKDGYVFIHDGARPFITEEILERAYGEVQRSRACVVGMPVKDTIKIADENGYIHTTPRRSLVWQIQTPQVFAAELIIPAYEEVIRREKELLEQGVQITDDAMVVENVCGCPVRLVEGAYENIKITTPEDLAIAGIFAGERRQNEEC